MYALSWLQIYNLDIIRIYISPLLIACLNSHLVFSNGNIVCLKFCFIQTVLFCTWKENLVQ